jgi:hypothetical protein
MATNQPYGVRVAFEPLRSIFHTSLSTMSYAALGDPLENACRMLSISNNTDTDILISFDFQDPHIYVAANGFVMRDFCANQDGINKVAGLPIGTQIWVVSVDAPTSGYVYAEVEYIATI